MLRDILVKATEQGSMSAYIAAMLAANVPGLPEWATYLIYAVATLKWLLPG